MQGNGHTFRVGVRVTYCVVQLLRTISTAHGVFKRRQSPSDWRAGYDHLNSRDLLWANAFSGGGVKITFQSSKHFQPGPPFVNARHPCGLVPCTAYGPPIAEHLVVVATTTQDCLAAARHPAAYTDARRSPVTPNEANRLMC